MDSRSAAHVLSQIGALLEVKGEHKFKARAYAGAARALVTLDTDDLTPLLKSGELAATSGIGPATLAVVRELIETGESSYLAKLQEGMPSGFVDLMRVPGLGAAKVQLIHRELGVETVADLEAAAQDGRLAALPRFGAKTAERVLKGIGIMRRHAHLTRFPEAAIGAHVILASVRKHPDVKTAEITGSIRRHNEVVADIDIAVECTGDPATVASSFGRVPGVAEAIPGPEAGTVALRLVDGTRLDLHCASVDEYPVALWRSTGSAAHVEALTAHAEAKGMRIAGNRLVAMGGKNVGLASETAFFKALGLEPIPPEMREGMGEVEAAAQGRMPELVTYSDLRGILHCHSTWSDGTATIAEMAEAARERGWSYIGISDHSEAAFYAGGIKRDQIAAQHDEIDALNEGYSDFRILKGIEADILADGRLDYGAETLARFDYVIGSIHSRFSMDGDEMTRRVLAALDDPHLTILAHPTGRLLLSREPYALDVEAVIARATERGVAVELNADPHRLDLDWRYCRMARESGTMVEIGPDSHSTASLDNVHFGIGLARKAWLEPPAILNTRTADGITSFARERGAR
ncbi:MAG TPA: DNA polymerase/3'-5' exonuclease PolX [Gemmatimonadaceae bacterium]|nr:DNA polymerase/3'-5' exonuclease PolX [Gemmatimonadaceae bacterium]